MQYREDTRLQPTAFCGTSLVRCQAWKVPLWCIVRVGRYLEKMCRHVQGRVLLMHELVYKAAYRYHWAMLKMLRAYSRSVASATVRNGCAHCSMAIDFSMGSFAVTLPSMQLQIR